MTDSEREKKLEELFMLAVDLPADEREDYIERHCADDPELRRRLEALLAQDATGTLLSDTAVSAPLTGQHIGRYTLVKLLGAGGMGSVYLARQNEPVQRDVALKMIHPGLDSEEVVQRFEMERQTLAMMNHPGIAEIYDGGVSESGQPYFVMEYVEGLPITEYCDRFRLPLDERLSLFCRVCAAVQHAHQKAIIHRDLKPGNVLVTQKGREALPKIIDFGIARAVARSPEHPILSTTTGGVVGTLLYMSPEQADPKGTTLDTRTDIYSLGVIFYELLAGRPPFDPEALGEKGIVEAQRILRDVDPPTPSARVAGLGDAAIAVAEARRMTPRNLVRTLEGDLDWITMKALEKDRARRYATAAEFRADVERHLADEPVEAGPPTMSYKTSKFVRRHRVAVTVLSLLLLSLIAGMTATTIAWKDAERARDDSAARAVELQQERDKSRAIVEFLTYGMLHSKPMAEGDEGLTVDKMLEDSIPHIERVFAGRPEAEAAVRTILGRAFFRLGELADARQQLDLAYKLRLGASKAEQFEALVDLMRVVRLTDGQAAVAPYQQRSVELAVDELGERYPELQRPLADMLRMIGMDAPTNQLAEQRLDALADAMGSIGPISREEFAMVGRVVSEVATFLDRANVKAGKTYLKQLEEAARSVMNTESVEFMTMLAVYADYWLSEHHFDEARRVGEELERKKITIGIPRQSWLFYEGDSARGLALGGLEREAEAEQILLDVFDAIDELPRKTQRLRETQQSLGELCAELLELGRLEPFLTTSWSECQNRPGAGNAFRPWWPVDARIALPTEANDMVLAIVQRAADVAADRGPTLTQLGMAQYRAGHFHDAIGTLSNATELNRGGNPYDLAYTVLALRRTDRADEAQAPLSRLRQLAKGADLPVRARAVKLLDQLEREPPR